MSLMEQSATYDVMYSDEQNSERMLHGPSLRQTRICGIQNLRRGTCCTKEVNNWNAESLPEHGDQN